LFARYSRIRVAKHGETGHVTKPGGGVNFIRYGGIRM
jgi:hypothetical protein